MIQMKIEDSTQNIAGYSKIDKFLRHPQIKNLSYKTSGKQLHVYKVYSINMKPFRSYF